MCSEGLNAEGCWAEQTSLLLATRGGIGSMEGWGQQLRTSEHQPLNYELG